MTGPGSGIPANQAGGVVPALPVEIIRQTFVLMRTQDPQARLIDSLVAPLAALANEPTEQTAAEFRRVFGNCVGELLSLQGKRFDATAPDSTPSGAESQESVVRRVEALQLQGRDGPLSHIES